LSTTPLIGRRVLVIGEGLGDLARSALSQCTLEFGTPESVAKEKGFSGPELVIMDAQSGTPAELSAAIEALARRRPPPPTLLVGEDVPMAVVRALMRLERSDVLEAPFTPQDLTRSAGELLRGRAAEPETPTSRCWAVTGAVGGAGATTVAVELAFAVAQGSAKSRVCLVDLNLADGAAAAYLGATPSLQLAHVAAADRMDAGLLEAFASRVTDRLDLVAAPRDPRAFANASDPIILRLLELACQVYDVVVVDVPRQRQSWSLDLLGGCDEVVVVSELTVPALIAARALATELEDDMPDGPRPQIVLNRLASRVFGPAPSLAEAEKALGRKACGAITSDWEAAAASVNLGGSIRHHRPKSRIVKDIENLAQKLWAGPSRSESRAA